LRFITADSKPTSRQKTPRITLIQKRPGLGYIEQTMQSSSTIAPVILAAGDSARMGYPKALLPLGNEVFLTRILRILRDVGLPKPTVILGRTAELIQPRIQKWPADILVNPDPDRGQLSSIQIGFSALERHFEAGMIWPVDHPAVSEDLIFRLTRLYIESGSLIAFPFCGGRRGHPAIFHRSVFQEFMEAPLAEGPKKILFRHAQNSAVLPTEESACVVDIDTPEDYLALTGESVEFALARMGL
jgi:molybdenum cofactor cytidylyltransferase